MPAPAVMETPGKVQALVEPANSSGFKRAATSNDAGKTPAVPRNKARSLMARDQTFGWARAIPATCSACGYHRQEPAEVIVRQVESYRQRLGGESSGVETDDLRRVETNDDGSARE